MNKINIIPGLLLIAILVITGQSCDNREDFFDKIDQAPMIIFEDFGEDLILVDTIKMGLEKKYSYKILSDEKLDSVLLDYNYSGKGVDITIDKAFFAFTGNTKGKNEIEFFAKDSYGQIARKTFQLEVIGNWLPVADMDIKHIGKVSPNEIEVDATASIDQDSRFGGEIVMYEYTLNNYSFESPLSKIRYIFGSGGKKTIRIRVKDNSGEWSEYVTELFNLE